MSDLKYQRIIQAVVETPWAILPQKFLIIRDLLAIRASGNNLTEEEIAERVATARGGNENDRLKNGEILGMIIMPQDLYIC